jgi:hypothetical protein
MMLNIAHFRTFGNLTDWKNIANVKTSFRPALDNLAGINPFRSDNASPLQTRSFALLKNQLSQRSPTPWIVNDILHNANNAAGALSRVDAAEFRSTLPVVRVSFKNIAVSLPLASENVAHSEKARPNRNFFRDISYELFQY